MYSEWMSSFCSISHTSRVNLVANPVFSHEWEKDREVFLWNISGFPLERVCSNKEATEPRVPLSSVEVSLRKINGRHHDLFYRYGIYVSQRTTDMFHLRSYRIFKETFIFKQYFDILGEKIS
jgi:hypothetical protein